MKTVKLPANSRLNINLGFPVSVEQAIYETHNAVVMEAHTAFQTNKLSKLEQVARQFISEHSKKRAPSIRQGVQTAKDLLFVRDLAAVVKKHNPEFSL